MFIFIIVLGFTLISYSLQNITDTIFNNKELFYSNIKDFNADIPLFSDNENKQIIYPSIHYSNFAFYFSVKTDWKDNDNHTTNETTKGVWLWLLKSSVNSTYNVSILENEQSYPTNNGIAMKINRNSLIAVFNDYTYNYSSNELENKPNPLKHIYNLTDFQGKEIFVRISLYLKYIYYEISNDGIKFNLWFVNEYIVAQGNNIHFEFIGNIKNEEIHYSIGNIYQMEFKGLISNSISTNKDFITLFKKFEQIYTLIQSFDIYNNLTQQLNDYPFEKMIEDNLIQIKKIRYINQLLSDHFNSSNTTIDNKTSPTDQKNKLDSLMNMIRNFSIIKNDLEKENSSNDILDSLKSLKEKQTQMNESIFAMYRSVSQSIENINTKTNKMEKYKTFEKVFSILIILSLLLLYSIYNNISSSNEQINNNSTKTVKPIVSGGNSQIEIV